MNQQQFFKSIEKTYEDGLALIKIKNSDYGADTDPFKNFRSAGTINLSPEKALLVRILDKISRIDNLLDKPNAVKDETVEDTLLDLVNYSAILKALIESKNEYGDSIDSTLIGTATFNN
jgi:hypothetical protein